MRAGCERNVVIATCQQRDLESTFLRCDNVAFTTLPQPKHNVVTTLSQRDFVCWDDTSTQTGPGLVHLKNIFPASVTITAIMDTTLTVFEINGALGALRAQFHCRAHDSALGKSRAHTLI